MQRYYIFSIRRKKRNGEGVIPLPYQNISQTIKINKNYLYIIIVSCGQNTISATTEATTANMKHTIINHAV